MRITKFSHKRFKNFLHIELKVAYDTTDPLDQEKNTVFYNRFVTELTFWLINYCTNDAIDEYYVSIKDQKMLLTFVNIIKTLIKEISETTLTNFDTTELDSFIKDIVNKEF
jgi:hypothetical protein